MEKRVYEFMIFQDKRLIYYIDPQQFDKTIDYSLLQQSHRIQNLYSTADMMSHCVKRLHPNKKTQPKNFKTREYQFSLLETPNGVKFVLLTSVRSDGLPDMALSNLFEGYINLVKKNYMYKAGELVRVGKFDEEVRRILKTMDEK